MRLRKYFFDNWKLIAFCCGIAIVNICSSVFLPSAIFQIYGVGLHIVLFLLSLLQMPILILALPLIWPHLHKKVNMVLTILLLLYTGFAIVGNYLFVYPVDTKISAIKLLYYLLAVLWCAPFCLGILALFSKLSIKSFRHSTVPKKQKLLIMGGSFLFIMIVGILYTIGYNPAISSYDTMAQTLQAKGITPLHNWHPPFHTLMIRGLLSVVDSPAIIVLTQWLFFALVWCSAVGLLLDYIPNWLCCVITAVVAILPANAVHLTTAWKDIPYSISLLWCTLLLAKAVLQPEKSRKSVGFFVQVAVALVFTFFIRQNGIVPFFTTIIALLLVLWRNKRLWASLAAAVMFIVLFRGVLFGYLQVGKMDPNSKYVGLSQDILNVYMAGGAMPEEAMVIVRGFLDYNDADEFNSYFAYLNFMPEQDISIPFFITSYMKTAFLNPGKIVKAVLVRMDCLYGIFPAKDGFLNLVNYTATVNDFSEWDEIYPDREPNAITSALDAWGELSTNPKVEWLTWRSGLLTLLLLCAALVKVFHSSKRSLLLIFPWVGQALSLLLSTGWSDFRYYWPLNLCALLFLLVALLPQEQCPPKDTIKA